jgi:GT2 family glycosyltransferase
MALASSLFNRPALSLLPLPLRIRAPKKALAARGTARLSVVIVNYRQWHETGALIRQLRAARCARWGRAEVVIIDNHSPPHPLRSRLRRLAGVSLRRWDRNRGFARAANEGCRLSRGEWCMLLNPDVSVPPDFLDQVLAVVDQLVAHDPRAGIVGFQLRNTDGTLQFSSGFFPTLFGSLAGLVLPRARRKYRELPLDRRARTSWVTGCCFLVRRECLQELGGFDEDFFLYYEDVDLCRRARAAGWSVWYEPTVQVVHHRPLHVRHVPAHLRVVTRHALLTYGARHWLPWQVSVLAHIVRLEAWLREQWCRWSGLPHEAGLFGHLKAIAADLARGGRRDARRKLMRVVRLEERLLDR